MPEIEIKLQVPPAQRGAIEKSFLDAAGAKRVRLQATYYETAGRALAKAGMALRVRREGRRWVQTLKGDAADGMTREEQNVSISPVARGESPMADLRHHAGTPLGERLLKTLQETGEPLQCLYGTDIWRRTRVTRTRRGSVELAFDEGWITAGERREPVCELEVELMGGSPLAVVDTARRLVKRHGLWLDLRTKAERGDLLSRGAPWSPPREAIPVALDDGMSTHEALRVALMSCFDHVAVNASTVASGRYDAEHVHQLRVGLRRLRVALTLFDPARLLAPLVESATDLLHGLGSARDFEAVFVPLQAWLQQAAEAMGCAVDVPLFAPQCTPGDTAEGAVRRPAVQALLLDLLACMQVEAPSEPPSEQTARGAVAQHLTRWHQRVSRDARRFAELDAEHRHELRRDARRLRHAVEMTASLFPSKAVRRYLKPLSRLQQRLGALHDAVVAATACRELPGDRTARLFALGWLAARMDALAQAVEPEIEAFLDLKRYWK